MLSSDVAIKLLLKFIDNALLISNSIGSFTNSGHSLNYLNCGIQYKHNSGIKVHY